MLRTKGWIIVVLLAWCSSVAAERIKDLATLAGVRDNHLVGYGLVVGLDGSGDKTSQTPFTDQSFKSMLNQFGIRMPDKASMQLKNVAAVAVSANLPAFSKPGQTFDITVSSIGNATSLRGGTLLMTPLKGIDGNIYAIAQGSVVVSGINAGGSDGSKITVNVPSSGRIANGATVERSVVAAYIREGGGLIYNLNQPDFTTAKRVADAINLMADKKIAFPYDAASVHVKVPEVMGKDGEINDQQRLVGLIAEIENVTLEPAEAAAKIVVNSRTGTIVIGQNVRVMPAAVSHGNLTVTITENPLVSQPEALSGGVTAVVPESEVAIQQQTNRAFVFAPGASLNDIVNAINRVGAAPGDLVAILEALKAVGALQAELQVI